MTHAMSNATAEALRHCRLLTRRRARNFYYGLRLLPEPRLSAMCAVYAWMRRADDLVDEAGIDASVARRRLDELREATDRAFAGDLGRHGEPGDDPILRGLAAAAHLFPLTVEPFHEMLEGQLDDLTGRRYERFTDLHQYCRRVASTVGLVSITIWGYTSDRARPLAIDRGIAFQLTNIIRDLTEDDDAGRVYLPSEDFARHGLTLAALRRLEDPARCTAFLIEQIDRAEDYYRRSADLDGLIDPSCRPTLWAMTAIYRGLLTRMRRDPLRLVRGPRLRLSSMQKGAIALTARWRARGESRTRGESQARGGLQERGAPRARGESRA